MQKITEAERKRHGELKAAKQVALNAIYYGTGLVYSAPGTGVSRFVHCYRKSSPEVKKTYRDAEHELDEFENKLWLSGIGFRDSFGNYHAPVAAE
jgi:hypothetical protein